MFDIKLHDNLINKRRNNIINHFANLPKVIAKLVSEYDYNLEGILYSFVINPSSDHIIKWNKQFPCRPIYVGSQFSTLNIWDPQNNKYNYSIDSDLVHCIGMIPDNQEFRLFSGLYDNTLKIWNLKIGFCDIAFAKNIIFACCLSVFPDGQLILGSSDKSISLLNSSTGKFDRINNNILIKCIAILPHGKIVTGLYNGEIKIWDAHSGKCIETLAGNTNIIECIITWPDGAITSRTINEIITTWDKNKTTGKYDITFTEHSGYTDLAGLFFGAQVVNVLDNETV
jgi:WD40 repeat protein